MSITLKRSLLGPAIALLLLMTSPAPATALLLSLDHPVYGPDSITRDTATGLDWLDVPATSGAGSWLDVQAQLGPGGAFEGFRHAIGAEIIQLWIDFGIPDINAGHTAANELPAKMFIEVLGPIVFQSGSDGTRGPGVATQGFTADPGGIPGTRVVAIVSKAFFNHDYVASLEQFAPKEETFPYLTHFLVRTVPEPPVGVLALAAVLSRSRRRLQRSS